VSLITNTCEWTAAVRASLETADARMTSESRPIRRKCNECTRLYAAHSRSLRQVLERQAQETSKLSQIYTDKLPSGILKRQALERAPVEQAVHDAQIAMEAAEAELQTFCFRAETVAINRARTLALSLVRRGILPPEEDGGYRWILTDAGEWNGPGQGFSPHKD